MRRKAQHHIVTVMNAYKCFRVNKPQHKARTYWRLCFDVPPASSRRQRQHLSTLSVSWCWKPSRTHRHNYNTHNNNYTHLHNTTTWNIQTATTAPFNCEFVLMLEGFTYTQTQLQHTQQQQHTPAQHQHDITRQRTTLAWPQCMSYFPKVGNTIGGMKVGDEARAPVWMNK